MTTTDQRYDAGFFAEQAARSLESARVVMGRVCPLLNPRRLLDVGCGVGTWLRAGLDLGACEVIGVDGDYVDRAALLIDPAAFIAADLAAPSSLREVLAGRCDVPIDLVICMEVAEHLPYARAASLIADLTSFADVVLFSAAIPFQYGTHHVNEQWPEYWSILFRAHGFVCFDCLRDDLWADGRVDWWYAQNALLFAREGSPAAAALPPEARAYGRGLAAVHPENLLANLLGLPRRYRQDAAAEEVQDLRSLVAAHQRGDAVVPRLAAQARSAGAPEGARNVFPWTRTEIYQPEQETAELERKLAQSGEWLQTANQAVVVEREARLAIDQALVAERGARLAAEVELSALVKAIAEARTFAAERACEAAEATQTLASERAAALLVNERALLLEQEIRLAREGAARDISILNQRLQAQAATRFQAEQRLLALQAAGAALERQSAAERLSLAAEREAMRVEQVAAQGELAERQDALERRAAELADQERLIQASMMDIQGVRGSRAWWAVQKVRSAAARMPRPMRRAASRLGRRGLQHRGIVVPNVLLDTEASEERQAAFLVEHEDLSLADSQPIDLPAEEMQGAAMAPGDLAAGEGPPLAHPLIKRYDRVLGEVRWWTLAAAVTRLRQFDVFDAEDYLRRNPDVAAAGMDPYEHFIQSGALEGRGCVDREDLARLMSGLMLFDSAIRALPPKLEDDAALPGLVEDVGPIGIYVSSHGNIFMDELAGDLATDLRSVGVQVDLLDENASIDARPPVCLFVAPHEFFILGRGPEWVRDDVLSNGFLFGTEQVQTTWFNTSLPFILMARGMLDICWQTAELFQRADMAAMHVLPGARFRPQGLSERDRRHPLFSVLPRAAQGAFEPSRSFAERPIDISFFGTSSPRRDAFFVRNAGFFAEYETFNYCRRPGRGPILSESEDGALTRLAGHVSGHSKITLNIHREEFGFFEWHRMVRLGMCSGSLIVSDPCLPHPSFVANEHYLQESPRHMPDLLEWLLKTESGRREAERVRANADMLITNEFETRHAVGQLLRFLSTHRAR